MTTKNDDLTRRDGGALPERQPAAPTVLEGFAHSPGPWTLRDDATFSTLGDKRISASNRISPAIVFGGLGAETDANAALIAAAPELLAVCKIAQPLIEEWLQGVPELAEQMLAAIAKAEGR